MNVSRSRCAASAPASPSASVSSVFIAASLSTAGAVAGGTPARETHAVLGRALFDVVEHGTTPAITARQTSTPFRAVDGG
ncbi:hypothetical protein GCM10010199_36270 [Dactylosporangium roseum]